jgi:hypothetical protein
MKKGLTATFKSIRFMKFIFPALAIILLLTQCSPTETLSEPESVEPDIEEEHTDRLSPEWYDPSVSSASDTTALYGYSHSIAADEARALETAEEMALVNLRFELDRYAEEIRQQLEEEHGSNPFGNRSFIIELRNTIQELDLSPAAISSEHVEEEGLHHIFIQASLTLVDANNMLQNRIDQEEFNRLLSRRDGE